MLKTLFFKKRSMTKYRENTLNEIRKNLTEYSRKHISIIECVSLTGPLTTELIFMYSSEKKEKKSEGVYDSILIMITNYYVMLYMDMYTGFYTVSKNYTCKLVSTLVEKILKEIANKQKGLKSNNLDKAIHKSGYFTRQIVEVYYSSGIEGCHKYLLTSVYPALLSNNKNLSIKRDHIEYIFRTVQAEKFLTATCYGDAEYSLEHTG